MQTEWTQPNEDEDDAAFLARCRKESPAFGLVKETRTLQSAVFGCFKVFRNIGRMTRYKILWERL